MSDKCDMCSNTENVQHFHGEIEVISMVKKNKISKSYVANLCTKCTDGFISKTNLIKVSVKENEEIDCHQPLLL